MDRVRSKLPRFFTTTIVATSIVFVVLTTREVLLSIVIVTQIVVVLGEVIILERFRRICTFVVCILVLVVVVDVGGEVDFCAIIETCEFVEATLLEEGEVVFLRSCSTLDDIFAIVDDAPELLW